MDIEKIEENLNEIEENIEDIREEIKPKTAKTKGDPVVILEG